jgi:hypothetical protein
MHPNKFRYKKNCFLFVKKKTTYTKHTIMNPSGTRSSADLELIDDIISILAEQISEMQVTSNTDWSSPSWLNMGRTNRLLSRLKKIYNTLRMASVEDKELIATLSAQITRLQPLVTKANKDYTSCLLLKNKQQQIEKRTAIIKRTAIEKRTCDVPCTHGPRFGDWLSATSEG